MRLPYRERFSLIINELGAAVAARSEDLQTALRRADPALAQTDNLLALLAGDAHTIQQLNVNADSVITALANSSNERPAVHRRGQPHRRRSRPRRRRRSRRRGRSSPRSSSSCKPALQKLGAAADAQDPVFQNLNAASANLTTFFHELAPFSHESVPSLKSLGQASAVGKPAVQAARRRSPTSTSSRSRRPSSRRTSSIVLNALDAHKRTASAGGPIEPDPRSPNGGKGYSGLEGVLSTSSTSPTRSTTTARGATCSGSTRSRARRAARTRRPVTIAKSLQQYQQLGGKLDQYSPQNPRSCYAFLGPNQPGVNESDPSWNAKDATPANPSACVPDPGGRADRGAEVRRQLHRARRPAPASSSRRPCRPRTRAKRSSRARAPASTPAAPAAPSGSSSGSGSGGSSGSGGPPNLGQTIGGVLGTIGTTTGSIVNGATGAVKGATGAVTGAAGAATGATSSQPNNGNQAQQLLNYLLAP